MSSLPSIQGDPTKLREDAPRGLFLARDGTWFHDGQQIVHERLSELLHRSIARDDDAGGALIVTTGRDRVPFACEHAPFVVRALEGTQLRLSDGSTEPLPAELRVDDVGHVHARVKGGRYWALLSRAAAQVVMAGVDDSGAVAVVAGGRVSLVVDERAHWLD